MGSVSETPNSFVWNHREILPGITAVAIPVAIEALNFGYQCYKKPGLLKQKFSDFKTEIRKDFCRQAGETDRDYYLKVAKNVGKIAAAILITAGIAVAAYYLAPAGLAVAATIFVAMGVFKTYQMIRALPENIRLLKDIFVKRPNESLDDFKQRRYEGCKKIALYTTLAAVSIGLAATVGYMVSFLPTAANVWDLHSALPWQTTAVVILEYAVLGIAHGGLSAYYYLKGDKALSAFHFSASLMSFAFPLCYAFLPGEELRIHHSFLGLSMMLLPSRSLKVLGTFMCADSSLYFFNLQDPSYDYMNALLDQKSMVATSIAATSLFQMATTPLFKEKEESK